MSIHQEIIDELITEYKDKEHVIGIWIFGSVAEGKERPDSDVDISIVCDEGDWELFKEERYGIKIDFEVISKKDVNMLVNEYPYLSSLEKVKIVFDKTGFVKKAVDKLKKYRKEHPEVSEFWEKEYQAMRKAKNEGKKVKNFIEVCDEAEIKFSGHHSVKRNILTEEFFHKHLKR